MASSGLARQPNHVNPAFTQYKETRPPRSLVGNPKTTYLRAGRLSSAQAVEESSLCSAGSSAGCRGSMEASCQGQQGTHQVIEPPVLLLRTPSLWSWATGSDAARRLAPTLGQHAGQLRSAKCGTETPQPHPASTSAPSRKQDAYARPVNRPNTPHRIKLRWLRLTVAKPRAPGPDSLGFSPADRASMEF